MVVITYGDTEVELDGAEWRGDDVWLPLEGLPSAIGWDVRPEGVCAGEICVPLPPGQMWWDDESFNVSAFARHIGLAEACDAQRGIVAFETPRVRSGGTATIEAPDFTLPDLDGNLHSLSDYRGKKVLLFTWASF
jgi:AhpC/TSA family